jgi:hypothetical protein
MTCVGNLTEEKVPVCVQRDFRYGDCASHFRSKIKCSTYVQPHNNDVTIYVTMRR